MGSLIKQSIQDGLTRLLTVEGMQNAAVWNDQANRLNDGAGYSFTTPAAFIEWQSLNEAVRLSNGITSQDFLWRVHLLDQQLDAADGTLDQNLEIFDLRDKVKTALTGMKPTNCGNLMFNGEEQDYTHNNLYHYILEFKAALIDTKGSPYDADSTKWIETTPPTGLDLTVEYAEPPIIKGS